MQGSQSEHSNEIVERLLTAKAPTFKGWRCLLWVLKATDVRFRGTRRDGPLATEVRRSKIALYSRP
jgi:hypothetical protein